jgi:hypothetical protein
MTLTRWTYVFFALCSCIAHAQQAASSRAKEPTGTVTGHVLCADTNLPARFASVLLQPVYEAVPPTPASGKEEQISRPTITISQTMLDGSYSITGVHPGRYYVIVEKPGYLSPLNQLTREQMNKPDEAAAALIAKLLVPVTVTAAHTAQADVRIYRGGTISGTVRFDDGGVNGGGKIALLRKNKDGKWDPIRTNGLSVFGGNTADDLGRYRFSGLPAGEYLVNATLDVSEVKVDNVFGQNHSTYFSSGYSLSIYSGGAVRERDAKSIKLADGEEADLVNIDIPLSTLHSVSGTIVNASGAVVNAGTVSLLYADDNTELVSTTVGADDQAFHFYFVPEGEYTLKAVAKDVTREEVPFPPGTMPPTHTEEKTVREYTEQKQPILIHNDMSSVLVTVIPKDSKAAPAPAAQ